MNKNAYLVVPPAYTGVSFLFCWTYLMFYATSAGIEAVAPIPLYSMGYTVSAALMAITLVVISFARIDRTALLTSKRLKALTGALLPVGTAILIGTSQSPHMVLVIAGGVITGIFSGIMLLQWVVAYQRIGLRSAAASFPMLMAISVGLCATLMYLPHTAITVATIALPIVSELMFHEVRKNPWPHFEDEKADAPDRPVNFVLMLLPFAVYALASGFLDYSSNNNNYTFVFYALGAFIPIVISGVYLFIVERSHFVSTFLVPLSFLIAVCVPFLTLGNLVPFSPFISIGELGIEVLIFIVPVGFAEFFSLDSLKTYALGRVIYVLFNAVGWFAAQFAYEIYGQFLHSQVSLVFIFVGVEVLAICLIVAIVKANKVFPNDELSTDDETAQDERASSAEAEDLESPQQASEQDDALAEVESQDAAITVPPAKASEEIPPTNTEANPTPEDVADAICLEYGLSQRERDVFVLLARGYTSTRIQKELYIAAGTVNYHSRNIYAKLGVHSKQELIALAEERMANAPSS